MQFPKPPPSKVTASKAPGTLNPPAPPDTFDQFAVLFQFPEAVALQNLLAAFVLFERQNIKVAHKISKRCLMILDSYSSPKIQLG